MTCLADKREAWQVGRQGQGQRGAAAQTHAGVGSRCCRVTGESPTWPPATSCRYPCSLASCSGPSSSVTDTPRVPNRPARPTLQHSSRQQG